MNKFPIPENESDRLKAVFTYDVIDSPTEIDLDELTMLASQICETPIALISLLDNTKQFFKSHFGLAANQTPKEQAFCAHAIMHPNQIMQIKDARSDVRFADNPLVTGDPNIVFYAGVPLVTDDGFPLGTLCVIDTQPRELSPMQVESLRILSKQVMIQLEFKKKLVELEIANKILEETNKFVKDFALSAAHDIKNPLTSILVSSQLLKTRLGKDADEKNMKLVDTGISSAKKLLELVNSMLEYSLKPALLVSAQYEFSLNVLLGKIISIIDAEGSVEITKPNQDHLIYCSEIALEQIFLNLLSNAIRYNDKPITQIAIAFSDRDHFYHFSVSDNGIGIAEEDLAKVFDKHTTLNVTDRFDQKGTGIGLANVKNLVEKLNGSISITSQKGIGSTFDFTIDKNPLTV